MNGKRPKEIAVALKISYDTVISHQKSLYRKLGVHNIREFLDKTQPNNGDDSPLPIDIPIEAEKKRISPFKVMILAWVALIAAIVPIVLLLLVLLLGKPFSPETPPEGPTAGNPLTLVMVDDSPYGWRYVLEPDFLASDGYIDFSYTFSGNTFVFKSKAEKLAIDRTVSGTFKFTETEIQFKSGWERWTQEYTLTDNEQNISRYSDKWTPLGTGSFIKQ